MKEIKYFCPIWGSEDLPFEQFVNKVRNAGYDGIEMNIPYEWDVASTLKLLREHNLLLIAQAYLPPIDETLNAYLSRVDTYIKHLSEFQPLFINSHTGKDFFTFEENCKVIEKVDELSEIVGYKIVHETHRGRFCYSPSATDPYINKYPEINFATDLSHWVCVSESLLDAPQQRQVLDKVISRTYHIHGRVGYSQGSQVVDPFIPEFATELETFLGWWKEMVNHLNRSKNKDFITISPEFGPWPYMSIDPKSGKPINNQWEVNVKMMNYLKENL